MHFSKDKLPQVARAVVAHLKENTPASGATVLSLSGDLGAGKTALVQQIAVVLGVSQVPPSPTFVIMRSYDTKDAVFSKLVHIDAYRIEDASEIAPLHLESVFAKQGSLVCVEWPEKIEGALPQGAIYVGLKTIAEDIRDIDGPESLRASLQTELGVV